MKRVRRIPLAGRLIALLACVNALAWGLIVPPFQVPDEPAHLYYAQYLGETGELPVHAGGVPTYAPDISAVLGVQGFAGVIGHPDNPVPATGFDRLTLRNAQAGDQDRRGGGNAATASNNPPLYYLVEAGAYRLFHWDDVTGRLAVMRAISALMAGLTTLCVFLFLRELLPRSPLSWAVGALAAGLQPTFAFISGGVNNDAGLYLASAALFLAVARVLRRGLTVRRAIAVGLLLALGTLVKTQVLAFAPGVALALLVAAWRGRADDPRPWRPFAAAVCAGAVPLAIYGILGMTLWDRPLIDRASDVSTAGGVAGRPWQIKEQVSYAWQLFLPRTPNLQDLLPGFPPYDLWLHGFIGRFGWLDYDVPAWMYPFARDVFIAVAVLAIVALVQRRRSLRPRPWPEIAVFAVMMGGLLAAIAIGGYRARISNAPPFEQARYLLPLLPLYALFPATALKALPARFAPALGALLVSGVLVHGVVAMLVTLQRYYG